MSELKILVVDDEVAYLTVMDTILSNLNYDVTTVTSPFIALDKIKQQQYDVVLTDLMMPEMTGLELLKKISNKDKNITKFIMVTGVGTYKEAIEAIRLGAFSYFIKGSDIEFLLTEIEKVMQLKEHVCLVEEKVTSKLLVSKSPKVQEIYSKLSKIAVTDASVMILGESGVGKEGFANFIHETSQRSAEDNVAVNCSSLSKSLIESELFGYEKGAFTGAEKLKIGKFELANNGTLFLDEVGDIPLTIQVKLLRFLEEKKIERVGGTTEIHLNTRIVSATNKNLHDEVVQGDFREDLFYRLNTFMIEIPPLRERVEDIQPLFEYFINLFSEKYDIKIVRIEEECLILLKDYDFPGNIRELRNIAESGVILSNEGVFTINCLPETVFKKQKASKVVESITLKDLRDETEKKYINSLLIKCDRDLSHVANILGITRRHLSNKIKEYNLI